MCVIVYLPRLAPSSACSHDSSRVARLDGEGVAPLESDGEGVVDRVGDGVVRGEGEVILTGEAELVDELLSSSADASSGLAGEGYEVGALSVCNLLILVLFARCRLLSHCEGTCGSKRDMGGCEGVSDDDVSEDGCIREDDV